MLVDIRYSSIRIRKFWISPATLGFTLKLRVPEVQLGPVCALFCAVISPRPFLELFALDPENDWISNLSFFLRAFVLKCCIVFFGCVWFTFSIFKRCVKWWRKYCTYVQNRFVNYWIGAIIFSQIRFEKLIKKFCFHSLRCTIIFTFHSFVELIIALLSENKTRL